MVKSNGERRAAPRRRIFVVMVVFGALVGAVMGALLASQRDAGFEATGTAFVAFTFPPEEKDPFSAGQFVTQRIDTYAQLGQSPDVLQAVATDVGVGSADTLAGKIKVAAVPGTVLLTVTVKDKDRARSVRLANSLMTNLNRAAMVLEAGRSTSSSPINLVTIQPPLAGPASAMKFEAMALIGGLVLGAIIGALVGRSLSRGTRVQDRPPAASSSQGGRHRGEVNADG